MTGPTSRAMLNKLEITAYLLRDVERAKAARSAIKQG